MRRRAGSPPRTGPTALLALLLLVLVPLAGDAQEKRPLDHDAYDRWHRIQQQALSPDGAWLRYRLVPGRGDAALHVRAVEGAEEHVIERGTDARFTRDSRFVVFRIVPTEEAREVARGGRNRPAPRDSLGILDLSTGEVERMPRLRGFTVPSESEGWILVHREAPRDDEADEEEEPEREEAEDGTVRSASQAGTDLHYRHLATGEERVLRHVTDYEVHEDGTRFVYVAATRDGNGDGVFLVRAASGAAHPLLTGEGDYSRLTLDRSGEQAAFLTDRDARGGRDARGDRGGRDAPDEEGADDDAPLPHSLYHAPLDGAAGARMVATVGSEGIPGGWWVSASGSVDFSYDGTRVLFGTAPAPRPDPEEDELLENVTVDVWSWHDDYLQPHQLQDLNQERRRSYRAVLHLHDDRIVQLADETLLSVTIGDRGDADVALGSDDLPYRQRVSWDTGFYDQYLVDPYTGARELLVEELRSSASLSPEARYVYWWDGGDFEGTVPRGWMVMDLETREVVNATAGIPHPVFNELSDRPAPPGSYGLGGWTEGDERMLVYDAHDLWLVDPRGADAPVNLTAGYGRQNDVRLRIVRLGWEDRHVPLDEDVLLSAFDLGTKADGYYRTRLGDGAAPRRLVLEDASFGGLSRSEDAEVLLFTRSTFQDFPDLWVSDSDFEGRRRLTEANPQQAEYRWGTAELVTWTSADGEELQGILYKPENFDPAREWPMMVYFYERSSNSLHNHYVPGTGTSINRSFYVSRGYLLFVPDIPYKAGYPGESAMNAVVPGVTALVDRGFVDRDRIGVQGHSWGGYQISYMVTRTDIFAAAEAGAPVTNMTSAYGGIRWASGRVRQMQYETGQSRIGGSLWEAQHRYIENSPLFTAYKVNTPLLILHNDEDGAVPWEEGIQFFVALRRLGKPVWLVNYNGQGHGVSGRFAQLDWSIRMQQFFDHYLQDAPPPVWMVEGIRAVDKGRTLGLDLVEPVTAADGQDGSDR
jgi:dienelactone hydrolase